jgi:DDE superfamily endonuclease/Helix-turn-helix of DDE superfamily endonuclease
MLNIRRVLDNDRMLRAFTGLNRKAFNELSERFGQVYQDTLRIDERPRKRARGGGRKPRLRGNEDRVFFILFYFKNYPTFDVLGVLFDLERGRAHRWVHRLQGILEATLGYSMVLPERKLTSVEEFMQRFPEVKEVIIDGTERTIQRPQDPERQKEHYSGKKKRHTRKHTVVTNRKKQILVLSKAREGKVHDKRQLAEEQIVPHIPDEIPIEVDLGYQGLQNEFVNIHLPHKKPKGQELTKRQKRENRAFSSRRVKCEHAIGGIKRYNAVSSIYRNRVPDFDDRLMLTAAGLWNFYLEAA